MNSIQLKNVCKTYPGFKLNSITLDLPNGAILGLVGENGAGKTTLIKLMLGMIKSEAGAINILNCSDIRANPSIKEEIGVVMDEINLPSCMRASEIGKMLSMIYKNWDQKKYEELILKLKVPADKRFADFSRGNKMKLGIICALSHHPRLLILDEATSGLDPIVRDELLDIFLEFAQAENHSILMSSHIVSDLEKVCDYIAFLHEGNLLIIKEKDKLLKQYGKINCSKDSFAQLNPAAVIGKREMSYGVECAVNRELLGREVNIQPIGLEELFVMMVKGDWK